MRLWTLTSALLALFSVAPCFLRAEEGGELSHVGVAAVDITPDYPIRLSGYGNRREESEGVELRIWAKALAFGTDADGPGILITMDNCGVPDAMRAEVVSRLSKKAGIKP